MSTRRVPIAIVGAGNITSLRHIPTFRASGRADIRGVIDRNLERARAVAERFRLPAASSHFDEPWMAQVEAVSIGVPPAEHAGVARTALELGKHVLLEKPMALFPEDARDLVELAAKKRLILAVVHNFQFARSAMRVHEMIRTGALGAVTGIFCFQMSTTERRLPVWHEELPMGLFFDESPHLLYLLKSFSPGPLSVDSVAVTPSRRGRVTPAVITAHLRAGHVPAVLYNNFEAPISEWHFVVCGEKKVAAIDVFRDVLVVVPNDGQHLPADILRTSAAGVLTHLWGVLTSGILLTRGRLFYGNDEVVRRFFDAIESGTPPRDVSGEDGLEIVLLQHRLLEMAAGSAIGR